MDRAGISTPPPPGRAIDLPGRDQATRRERTLLGGLILAIASVWIALPLLPLITGAPQPLPGLGVAATCGLIAVGIGQVLWALDLLLRRRTLIIGEASLELSVRGLLGARRWREPLANYRGLRHRRERVRHRYGWRMVYRLELAHPDPTKELCLISTRDGGRIEACGRQWAARLGLPVLPVESAAAPRRVLDLVAGAATQKSLATR
ncbi:MAG TPA: hypothetical protein VLE23_17310 [Geminicoccaceae bacterium]|nr:hypothetical protein [Geminicoccaceae bacterium]